MSLAELIIRTIYGRQDNPATPPPPTPPCLHIGPCPDEAPAPRPPAVSDAPMAPQPAPVPHPARPEPAQARTEPPTDTPPKGTDARWHADEAEGLAKLADLTAWCRDPRYAADLWFGDNR